MSWLFDECRDWLFNNIAVWGMKHCHNWAPCFYTACEQLTALELEYMAKEVIQAKKEK